MVSTFRAGSPDEFWRPVRAPQSSQNVTKAEGTAHPFACPRCTAPLRPAGADTLICPADGATYRREEGIWRLVLPERAEWFRPFLHAYEAIRRAEGRGSHDPAYYRALPFRDLTGRHSAEWAIRAASYRTLIARVLAPLERQRDGPLHVVDAGAGNGWLAARLAGRGHRVVAVDLQTDPFDGLGAAIHYEAPFEAVQADFHALPVADGWADVVVFNGAFHYAVNETAALLEAVRALRPGGAVVIMDSPFYFDAASGAQMREEQAATLAARYGVELPPFPGRGFVAPASLARLSRLVGLAWTFHWPVPVWRHHVRRWRYRRRAGRDPAGFPLIVGRFTGWPPSARDLLVRLALRLRFRLAQRHRHRRPTWETVAGLRLHVLPDVFNPKLFSSGELLAQALSPRLVPPGSRVLDMGTGTGIGALVAARWAAHVVAVDINPEAVRCARQNAALNGVADRVAVRQGDLFAPVRGEPFDVILFNPPYFRGQPRDWWEHAWRSPDVLERFAAGLDGHLAAGGWALLVLSTAGVYLEGLRALRRHGFTVRPVAERRLAGETLVVYRVMRYEEELAIP